MSFTENTTPAAGDPGTEGVAGLGAETSSEAGGAVEGSGFAPPEGGVGSEGAPAPAYLDPEQYGTHLVRVKVGGEDVELPFAEAIQGVMRQQDYTQKTQSLAEERRQLQQADALVAALESDPVRTLKQLAEVYDLDPNTGLAPIERDPTEQRLVDMQRQMQQTQEQYARQMMQNEVNALRAVDPNLDLMALGQVAKEQGLTLTAAHRVMQAEQVLAKQQEAAKNEQRRQAALAAQVAHDGTATQRGSVAAGSGRQINSIRDAWNLAKESKS